jgi:N-acyl homoserine lactone hydrolase
MNTATSPRLYAFHAGGDLADLAVYDPFDPNIGTKVYEPWFFYVLTHPAGNVIFDTGVHPALVDDPRSRLGSWADLFEMRMESGHDSPSQLASIGLEPADISTVVLSHMHFDHVSALELFRHAEIIVQRTELAFAYRPAVYQAGTYLATDFNGEFNWRAIDGFLDLFDDGVAQIIPTPGHTPGHQSMLVKLDRGSLLLIADATYQLPKMRERLLPAIVWNPDAMVSSWQLLEWLESREHAQMLCSHDLDFRARVKLAPTDWYE